MHRDDKPEFVFQTFQGAPMEDPRPEIKKNKTAGENYDGKLFEPINYRAEHKPTQIYIAERWGQRATQEDRIIINQIPLSLHMSQEEIESAIKSTLEELSEKIKQNKFRDGSTFNMSLFIGNTVYNANVGDSEAFLVIRDKEKKLVSFERLNKETHDINDDNVERLKKEGFNIVTQHYLSNNKKITENAPIPQGVSVTYNDHRLESTFGLNMYRSMGDTVFESSGLVHTPDISMTTVNIPPGGDAFVINACDGLTETIDADQERSLLKQIIEGNPGLSISDLIAGLATWAEQSGSMDNISLSGTMILPNAVPRYMAVCDGHGGTQVAEYLSENFHAKFVKHCGLQMGFNALNEEQRVGYMINYNEVKRLLDESNQIDPRYNLDMMFEIISNHFINTLQEQKDPQEKSQYIMSHWNLIKELAQTTRDAVGLTHDLDLKIPSSLSSQFAKSPVSKEVKSAIVMSDAQVISAVAEIAYSKDAQDKTLIKKVIATLKENTRVAKEAVQKGMFEHRAKQMKEHAALLDGRPFLRDIQERLNELPDKLKKDPSFNFRDATRHLLLEAYIEVCKHTLHTPLLGSPRSLNEFQHKLEQLIDSYYSDIAKSVPNSNFANSLGNRILFYAGNKYPDLIEKIERELQDFQNNKENMTHSTEDKSLFLNTSKLLARLGSQGFNKASAFFNKEYGQAVKEDEMLSFFEEKISTHPNAHH